MEFPQEEAKSDTLAVMPLLGENVLPESRDDFPKLLYLDQNKWIDLSNAHYRHSKGEPFKEALAGVRKAVDAGD